MRIARTTLSSIFILALIQSTFAALPGGNNGFDHRAHAVPGGPYNVPDSSGNGNTMVTLNGELSHSHFFNPKNGMTGKVIRFKWTVKGKVICTKMICNVKFPLGKTVVKLQVFDNTGDKADALTTVNVFKGAKSGVRFWYYPGSGWAPDKRFQGPKPTFSVTAPMVNLNSRKRFPGFLKGRKFSMRMLANLDFFKQGNYQFRIGCLGGSCTMWQGSRLLCTGSNRNVDSKHLLFSRGVRRIEAIFRYPNAKGPAPKFTLSWKTPGAKGWNLIPAKFLSHSPATYAPVIHAVAPKRVQTGSVLTITGSSFLNIKAVRIGKTNCVGPVAPNQFAVKCVVQNGIGKAWVTVQTNAGTSNAFPVQVVGGSFGTKGAKGGRGVGYFQPIKFTNTFLKRGGKTWNGAQLTAITLGPDNRYYMGSLNGFIHVVTTDFGANIINYCRSPNVGRARSVLGVAFNPAENNRLRLYASTSVLYWGTKKLLPFQKGWNNGEIIAMHKSKQCMTKVETVISGLPVSNYDHSVNGISFDHYGNLLVTVGGGTNAGVSKKGDPLGGVPDSPLSAAMLMAPILKKGFNGKVRYNNYNDPGRANKISGQVFVHASGLRNSLCSVAHSNGHIYATDNGANSAFGARSTSCKSQGGLSTEPDTLKKIRKGGFYGYSNRNRGRYDKKQCIHRSPQMNMGGYDRHIATFESSTDGIIEYTANTFGGQMRGDLLASKFAVSGSGMVYRLQLNKNGLVKSKFPLSRFSGLTAAMSPTGGIVMPRVYQGKVAVLLPQEKNPGKIVVTSVNPFRGPKRGGGIITVTGWNLNPPLKATVGGKACTNIGNFRKGRSFTCQVPAGVGRAPVVVTRFGKKSGSFGFEYMYMNV